MQFPLPPFGYRATSHAKLRPDERPLDDGLISIAWNAGTLHFQYVGLESIDQAAVDQISHTLWQFTTQSQLLLVLYASVLANRDGIRSQLSQNSSRQFAVTENDANGAIRAIWAWLPREKVLDAFTPGGEFETAYAKAFVVFAYHLWEDFARPIIAKALDVHHDCVKCDLMGEWRHLRNWIIHPSENTEKDYFENAELLRAIPGGPQPGDLTVMDSMVFQMMGYLNSLHITVNPKSLDPGIELSGLDPTTAQQIADLEPNATFTPVWRTFAPPYPYTERPKEE